MAESGERVERTRSQDLNPLMVVTPACPSRRALPRGAPLFLEPVPGRSPARAAVERSVLVSSDSSILRAACETTRSATMISVTNPSQPEVLPACNHAPAARPISSLLGNPAAAPRPATRQPPRAARTVPLAAAGCTAAGRVHPQSLSRPIPLNRSSGSISKRSPRSARCRTDGSKPDRLASTHIG